MPAEILIIDDNYDPSVGIIEWKTRVESTNNIAISIGGRNHLDIYNQFVKLLAERDDRGFDATILDIMFKEEQLGGIQFFRLVEANGLSEKLGLLLVSTNSSERDEIDLFGAENADGRVYYDKLNGSLSMEHLCHLLSLIPNAVQCQ